MSNPEETIEKETTTDEKENFAVKLRPKHNAPLAPKGTDHLEAFLKTLESDLLEKVFDNAYKPKLSKKNETIKQIFKEFKQTDDVIVPTDKTNSIRVIKTKKYKEIVYTHLDKSASEIPHARLVYIHKISKSYLESIANRIPKLTYLFIDEALKSRAIPSPKALIKDHKKRDANGDFPSRLVIPATNFTAPFAKVGYLGIKSILDNNKVEYDTFTIQNSNNLKDLLEIETFSKDTNTLFALVFESMYPSIKF